VKLSIYEFRDLTRSYGIVELTDREYEELLKSLDGDVSKLIDKFKAFLGNIKCLKESKGVMMYEEKLYDMIYIMAETEDGDQYVFEIYPNSMAIASNTAAQQLFKIVYMFVEVFIGNVVEKPKSMLVGLL